MKKIFMVIMVLSLASACKKEQTQEASTKTPASDTPVKPLPTTKLTEINPEEASKLLATKTNDTLYVTNFFATWCGPCMKEIPHFKEKMEELKNEKVKFTFISVDQAQDWDTEVKDFAASTGLEKNIKLFNPQNITEDFFSKNFKEWDGGAIPFTLISKGDKREEIIGMLTKADLTEKINAFK